MQPAVPLRGFTRPLMAAGETLLGGLGINSDHGREAADAGIVTK